MTPLINLEVSPGRKIPGWGDLTHFTRQSPVSLHHSLAHKENWLNFLTVRSLLHDIASLVFLPCEACVVSPLHDGMNLVAKEYVAAKNDGNAMLVSSRFTGAARELGQALLINPYDAETFADTLAAALAMDAEERVTRIRALRATVERNNIYRWAGKMLTTLASLHSETGVGLREPHVWPSESFFSEAELVGRPW